MTEQNKKDQLILAIESSCDETSVAVIKNGNQILSNIVASQIKSHQRFGGVVPEIASRHHVEEITHCFHLALTEAAITADDLVAVAVTEGPGLVGALLIGISAAKAFAWAHDLPLIPVNHMAGHIYAAQFTSELKFPLMALLVSGGHTELVLMTGPDSFEIIGETRDDAAGEAYDKVGRVLGLAYPSGRELDQLAQTGKDTFDFPRAMLNDATYDFSFSGLKSSFINTVHNAEQRQEELKAADLAASFQASVVEVLVTKTLRACQEYQVKQLVIAGGVAANQGLRSETEKAIEELDFQLELLIPEVRLCGDNAAMIGAAAFAKLKTIKTSDWAMNAQPNLSLQK